MAFASEWVMCVFSKIRHNFQGLTSRIPCGVTSRRSTVGRPAASRNPTFKEIINAWSAQATGSSPPTLRRASVDRGDDDRSDEGSDGDKIGIAFGQDVDRGKIVFAEQIGQPTETPAQDHHVAGGEGKREFLRRGVLVLTGVRVGFQGVINQLAGVEATPALLVEMKLDAGAILDAGGIAVVFDGVHGVMEG